MTHYIMVTLCVHKFWGWIWSVASKISFELCLCDSSHCMFYWNRVFCECKFLIRSAAAVMIRCGSYATKIRWISSLYRVAGLLAHAIVWYWSGAVRRCLTCAAGGTILICFVCSLHLLLTRFVLSCDEIVKVALNLFWFCGDDFSSQTQVMWERDNGDAGIAHRWCRIRRRRRGIVGRHQQSPSWRLLLLYKTVKEKRKVKEWRKSSTALQLI